MNVLAVSGSPRKKGMTAQIVENLAGRLGDNVEYVSLAGKKVDPCRMCLGCVKDNTCRLKDDMTPLRDKIMEADLLVIGGSNMNSRLNGLTHAFLERFFQFHHQGTGLLAGKKAIVVGVGGGSGKAPAKDITSLIQNYGVKAVKTLTARGPFACVSCPIGEECEISLRGHAVEEDLNKRPELLKEIEALAAALES